MAKKCPSCEEKIKKKFTYCPSCGYNIDGKIQNEDYGMLGRNDRGSEFSEELKLPFGMGKIVNSLVKQLERQLSEEDFRNTQLPRGIKIRVTQGQPQNNSSKNINPQITKNVSNVTPDEMRRRINLPKVNAESKVRRFGDNIVYEIKADGVKSRNDIVITKLASGIEIKVYTQDKCYVKNIPLTVEVTSYSLRDNKVFVELRG